jgi:hypothetical protein
MAGTVVLVVGILPVAGRSGAPGRMMAGTRQAVAGMRQAVVGMQQAAAGTPWVVAGKRPAVGKLVEVTPLTVVGKLHRQQGPPAEARVGGLVGPFQSVVGICTLRTPLG